MQKERPRSNTERSLLFCGLIKEIKLQRLSLPRSTNSRSLPCDRRRHCHLSFRHPPFVLCMKLGRSFSSGTNRRFCSSNLRHHSTKWPPLPMNLYSSSDTIRLYSSNMTLPSDLRQYLYCKQRRRSPTRTTSELKLPTKFSYSFYYFLTI